MTDIERRLANLEDDRAIRDLKMRYLRAADAKDPDAMADCLLPDARIAFDGFPAFDNRDDFISVYREFGCAAGIFDIHHGGPGIIEIAGTDAASGWWPLIFHNINLTTRRLTRFGVEYSDLYVRGGARWWISETTSVRKSCLVHAVGQDGSLRVETMGLCDDEFL